jgi:hypothetical protein
MVNINKPGHCSICGYYLTTDEQYTDFRCLDPSHWLAAGLLAPTDFYPMARITAQASAEMNQLSDAPQNGQEQRLAHLPAISTGSIWLQSRAAYVPGR